MFKMNIFYPIIDGEVTGGNMICLRLIEEAKKRGWEVFVNSPTKGPFTNLLGEKGVTLYQVDPQRSFHLDKALQLAKIIRKESIDIVHTHTPLPDTSLIRIACKMTNTPVINHEHGLAPLNANPLVQKYQLWLNRYTAQWVDQIIAVSKTTRKGLLQRGIPKNKIRVVYNGISVDNQNLERNLNFRDILGIPLIPKFGSLIGQVGRIDKKKGQHILIQALPDILREFPETYLIIVGEDFKDGEYVQKLKRLSEQLDISDHVIFTGYREDVMALMRAFDLFVLPSFAEGLPVVILEAMAAAKPVVATKVGGNDEVVVDGETGTIIPPGDTKALAEAIIAHLNNPDRSKQMGQKGYERVKEHFSEQKMVEQTFKIYEEVLRKRECNG